MTNRSASRLMLIILGATGVVSGTPNRTFGFPNSKSGDVLSETDLTLRSGARKLISLPSRRQNAMPWAPCSEIFQGPAEGAVPGTAAGLNNARESRTAATAFAAPEA